MPEETGKDVCITVEPGSKKIFGTPEVPLINLLAENGIFLRSDCGGKGVCCKCKVELGSPDSLDRVSTLACTYTPDKDLVVRILDSSLISPHVLKKEGTILPNSFTAGSLRVDSDLYPGLAVDLGTTTIAVYLCDINTRTILSSIAVKNPQSLCGDDVVNRIAYIGKDCEKLSRLQHMVTNAISWGVKKLIKQSEIEVERLERMIVVGNPTMIHIFSGISPYSIGVAPYVPSFYDAQLQRSEHLFADLPAMNVYTFPQTSGFIGGDILAAAIGTELDSLPPGTLLIDLGTNGELMLKDEETMYTTSCATGPAFEGASLSCGIQAVPGAIDRVKVGPNWHVDYSVISGKSEVASRPIGICGSGIISAVAAFVSSGIIDGTGRYNPDVNSMAFRRTEKGVKFTLYDDRGGGEVSIDQKDIRSLQLGKAALRSGIEVLLKETGRRKPESIIVAGAFGSHIDKMDLLTLGMVPDILPEKIVIAGNAAGAGAIMALCDEKYLKLADALANSTKVIQLAENSSFQNTFISHLEFH